jgi:hypothetical protein
VSLECNIEITEREREREREADIHCSPQQGGLIKIESIFYFVYLTYIIFFSFLFLVYKLFYWWLILFFIIVSLSILLQSLTIVPFPKTIELYVYALVFHLQRNNEMNSKRMESPERIQGGAKLTAKTIWKTCQP